MDDKELLETCSKIDAVMRNAANAKNKNTKDACYALADTYAKRIVEAGLENRNMPGINPQ